MILKSPGKCLLLLLQFLIFQQFLLKEVLYLSVHQEIFFQEVLISDKVIHFYQVQQILITSTSFNPVKEIISSTEFDLESNGNVFLSKGCNAEIIFLMSAILQVFLEIKEKKLSD